MRRPSDPLLRGLVDDAALFPPGNAPMDTGLADHARYRSAWYADLVGPFLAPASRVAALTEAMPDEQDLRLAIVFDVTGEAAHQALRTAAADPRTTVAAIEASLATLGDDARAVGANLARLPGATGFLEVPRLGFDAALDLVLDSGWHAAKYRTGGPSQSSYPTERELAAFLVAVTERDLPFKLTAGLHHAVRSADAETGLEQHGVLNVLVATRVAQQGGAAPEVAAVLAQRDPTVLLAFVEAWDEGTSRHVREAFLSFGCCGVTDPIEELVALGLLEAGA
jgi:hypothetical protein